MSDEPERPIRFETHIRQMVRLLDHDSMVIFRNLDLWNYDVVKSRATQILARIQHDMPPINNGGPWPNEWIAVFKRWMDEGFQRLELGTPQGSYTATRKDGKVTLKAQGNTPAPGYGAWLDAALLPQGGRQYTLYFEPPTPPAEPSPTPFMCQSKFFDASLASLTVVDAVGTQSVPIIDTPPPAPVA